jgi:HSP20 family molecular chaperone IbpA
MSTLLLRDRSSLLDELFGWMGATPVDPPIRVEEYVEDGRRTVRADVPGVDPEDIHLTLEREQLRLRAERRFEEHDEHRSEIRYGSFERVMGVPRGTKAEDVTATYADGVLTVTMPVDTEVVSTRIPVTQPSGESADASDERPQDVAS